jgi:hypothetical protein
MDERTTKRGGPLCWLGRRSRRFWIVIVALPVLYVLSSGPMVWLAVKMGAPDWVFGALETVYGPSLWLAMWSGRFGQPYLAYFAWWQSLIISSQ